MHERRGRRRGGVGLWWRVRAEIRFSPHTWERSRSLGGDADDEAIPFSFNSLIDNLQDSSPWEFEVLTCTVRFCLPSTAQSKIIA